MSEEHLVLVTLILNPWNAVLGFCVWAGIQTVKSLVPALQEGGSLHHTLRFACVAACTVCYFVPGPWTDHEISVGMKLILGIITGTVTTLAHGMTSDARKFLTRFLRRRSKEGTVQDAAKDIEAIIGTGKKLVTVLGGVGVAFSGVYGAWLKPTDTTKAKAAYEVTEEGIEELSGDIDDIDSDVSELVAAHNVLDRQTAIDIAMLKKQVRDLQEELKHRHRSYEPARVTVNTEDLSMAAQVEIVEDFEGDGIPDIEDPDAGTLTAPTMAGDEPPPKPKSKRKKKPRIKRDGKKLDLPSAGDLF